MSDWKKIVRTVAPTLGTALGGPMAGVATKFIADKLLGKSEATESEIEQAIAGGTPEQLAKLKEIDNQFKLEMEKLRIDLGKIQSEDRDSARKLFQVNVWPQIVLSVLFVGGYFTIVFALFTSTSSGIMQAIHDSQFFGVFTTLLGILTAAIPQILGFWFGSSMEIRNKTPVQTK
uniref:Holin of 3TMs, for gene-transfer release n=1 Tax=Candidatus Kentrum sp. FM TaxID=2126340 RepID=A0A450U1G4_9GAMM|nr:MAG: hypothetical protein BECKFM1743C_GA0114222_109181 [Candidatus Kentron sp. FM]VFJ76368.1 MAG: hypothetical protein BECKFM1743A_GA0114220_109211 [Candidatus Kentron sp. FM]VFK23110.1 MAG: hypothetical protein BECKFM1743B_GA0114221_109021 [Candidatus Kentron sp. FM]